MRFRRQNRRSGPARVDADWTLQDISTLQLSKLQSRYLNEDLEKDVVEKKYEERECEG